MPPGTQVSLCQTACDFLPVDHKMAVLPHAGEGKKREKDKRWLPGRLVNFLTMPMQWFLLTSPWPELFQGPLLVWGGKYFSLIQTKIQVWSLRNKGRIAIWQAASSVCLFCSPTTWTALPLSSETMGESYAFLYCLSCFQQAWCCLSNWERAQ